MLPAKERLESGDLPTCQTRLWLVVKHEFTPCQRAPELRFNFQASHRALVHLRQVELINPAALLFSLKHRRIGIPEQAIRIRSIPRVDTDPEAYGSIDFLAIQLE